MRDILKNINFTEVIVLAVFYFFLGYLWYSPVLFSNLWMDTLDMPIEQLKSRPLPMPFFLSVMGVYSFLIIFILAIILRIMKAEKVYASVIYALLLSKGFIILPSFASHTAERTNLIHYLINYTYPVTGIVISAVILTVWRKKAK